MSNTASGNAAAGSCECGNEAFSSIKVVNFFTH
jgi:hypothetical protein